MFRCSDSLCLSLKYTDNINDAFNCWVKKIDSFTRNKGQEMREVYFMEKINCNSSTRGFEFVSLLPTTSACNYRISNNIVELNGVDSINKAMLYNSKEHEMDLKKFPRFQQRETEKNAQNPEYQLPLSLSANVFIEIPKQLRNLSHITKFLDPFETICFKSMHYKFKDALDYYLRPQYQLCVNILCSTISWKRRIREHKRRVFNEKQRRGLYFSMIKHEVYPNYWKFSQTDGNDVRCIEFFDFVRNKCNCVCK